MDSFTSTVGTPSFLRRTDIIATVIELIRAAWVNVCKRTDVDNRSDEPTIAGALYIELWEEKQRRRINGPPQISDEAATRSSGKYLKPQGRIDFKLFYGWNEQSYFGMECKRLTGSSKYLAKEYIHEGIMRYVSCKYSPGHDWAAMLGFVIDNNCKESIELVSSLLQEEIVTTKMTEPWQEERSFGKQRYLYRTKHYQDQYKSVITILHLFLSFS